jgi:hypothetical protein
MTLTEVSPAEEIVGWNIELHCRTKEAIELVDRLGSEFETLDQTRKEIAAYIE